MAHKPVCLVPHGWTMNEYRHHTCDDGSHSHLSASQLRRYVSQGLARVLARASEENARTIAVRKQAPHVKPQPAIRDRSCRVGEPIAVALCLELLWARIMFAEISRPRKIEIRDRGEELA